MENLKSVQSISGRFLQILGSGGEARAVSFSSHVGDEDILGDLTNGTLGYYDFHVRFNFGGRKSSASLDKVDPQSEIRNIFLIKGVYNDLRCMYDSSLEAVPFSEQEPKQNEMEVTTVVNPIETTQIVNLEETTFADKGSGAEEFQGSGFELGDFDEN